MLKATWRRPGSPAWLAVGLVILVPALAEAQLFPNRTIKRERPSPAAESPFIGQVRRDYFGYFPTCWTRFPAGWACPCPNPELPNRAASFQKVEFNKRHAIDDVPPEDDNTGMPDDRGPNPPMPGDNPVPPPDTGRSPFELDNPRPPTNRPAPTDPFTDPAPNAPKAPAGGNNPAPLPGRPGGTTGLMEMPALPATSPTTNVESNLVPGAMELAPEATLASNSGSERPDLGPLPTAPTPAPFTPMTASSTTTGDVEPIANMPAPAQAPKRRSFLSSLFGRGNTRNR